MEQALLAVTVGVVVVALLVGLATFAGSRRAYEEIGAGGIEQDPAPREPTGGAGAAGAAEQAAEIRQMLEARNSRRIRRGEEPLDVEAEVAALTSASAPAADPALEEEVRQLVVARNARRVRRGEKPLDVEAEVRRQLAALG